MIPRERRRHWERGIDKVADEYGIEPDRMDTLANYVFAEPPSDGVNTSHGVCGEFLDSVDDPDGTYLFRFAVGKPRGDRAGADGQVI